MSKLTEQFKAHASVRMGSYLRDSLNFMTADTRQGITGAAKKAFDGVKSRAKIDPKVAEYVERIEHSVARRLHPSAPKPSGP